MQRRRAAPASSPFTRNCFCRPPIPPRTIRIRTCTWPSADYARAIANTPCAKRSGAAVRNVLVDGCRTGRHMTSPVLHEVRASAPQSARWPAAP
eukprot:1273106-Prymnesium_polylepis.1